MNKILIGSFALCLLAGCNTVDGIGKDFGAVGQSFGNLFDGSVQNSRAIRDNNARMMGGGMPQQSPMMGNGGGNPYGGSSSYGGGNSYGGGSSYGGGISSPPQFPPYGAAAPTQPVYSPPSSQYGGGGYGGTSSYGGYDSGMGNSNYQAQPRPPAMPYYY